MHLWEMPGMAVMKRGKVEEIKRVPFKKKLPVPRNILNDSQTLAFSPSIDILYAGMNSAPFSDTEAFL